MPLNIANLSLSGAPSKASCTALWSARALNQLGQSGHFTDTPTWSSWRGRCCKGSKTSHANSGCMEVPRGAAGAMLRNATEVKPDRCPSKSGGSCSGPTNAASEQAGIKDWPDMLRWRSDVSLPRHAHSLLFWMGWCTYPMLWCTEMSSAVSCAKPARKHDVVRRHRGSFPQQIHIPALEYLSIAKSCASIGVCLQHQIILYPLESTDQPLLAFLNTRYQRWEIFGEAKSLGT